MIVSVGTCKDSASINVVVNPLPNANAGTDITIEQGQTTTLISTGGGNYNWSNGNNGAVISVSPITATDYCVTVVNANVCSDSSCVTVYVKAPDCPDNIFLPNAFSPNYDGENDVLHVYCNPFCVKEIHLRIFNRWGEKVFETTDVALGLNGEFKENIFDSGVFTYFFDAELINGTQINKKGNVSLIR